MLKTTRKDHVEFEWFITDEVSENKKPQAEEPVIEKKASTVELTAGSQLAAKDYVGFNLYLVLGQAELVRRGMADQILRSNGQWNAKESVFNNCEGGAYIRAITDSQLLVLPKESNEPTHYHSNIVKSERLFSQVATTLPTKIKEPQKVKNTQSVATKQITKTIEVSIYDLDRPYEDTLVIPVAGGVELVNEIEEIKSKQETKSDTAKNLLVQHVKKSEAFAKNIRKFVKEKMPVVVNDLANIIDSSMKVREVETQQDKYGSFSSIGKWAAIDYDLPKKSGLYYVSNGKDVSVAYFNKNTNKFHDNNEKIGIKFWSSNKVNLKD